MNDESISIGKTRSPASVKHGSASKSSKMPWPLGSSYLLSCVKRPRSLQKILDSIKLKLVCLKLGDSLMQSHVDNLFFFAEPETHIDSEYSRAGIADPKIVITTSRDPSSKLLQFAKVFSVYHLVPLDGRLTQILTKEMRLVFPNAHRINRGNYVVKELAEACRANDVTDLVIVHEHRGTPGTFDHFFGRLHLSHTFVHRCSDCITFSSRTHCVLHPQQRRFKA